MSAHPSASELRERIDQVQVKALEDHKRIRGDVDGIGGKVNELQRVQTDILLRVTTIERMPMSAEKITFSGRLLVAIIGSCIAIAGGMWQLHIGIGDIQKSVESAAKLQDERTSAQKEKMDDLGRQIEMRRVEIQRIADKLTDMQTKQETHR